MIPVIWQFIIGLLIVYVIGSIIPHLLTKRHLQRYVYDEPEDDLSTWNYGLIERTVFAIMVVIAPTVSVEAIGGWMALKLAAGWGSSEKFKFKTEPTNPQNYIRAKRQLSLIASLCSLTCAYLGGLLMSAQLSSWWKFLVTTP